MLKKLTKKIILSVVLTGIFCLIPLASAEAATFSGMTPAAGATITWGINPEIKLYVSDSVNLDKDSLTATVNGKSEPASLDFKETGYYENEDYMEGWVMTGYDYTQGYINIKPAKLADGPAAVAVLIKNINGAAFTKTWTFNVSQPPSISDFTPAYNVVGSSTTISAKVAENGTVSQWIMTVNGAVVPAAFDPATGTVIYTTQLTSGSNYNVSLTVTDSFGLTTSISWYFYSEFYQDSQVNSLACRDCHSGVFAPIHPMNNCALCHSSQGPIYEVNDGCMSVNCHSGPHGSDRLDSHNCTECHRSTYPNIPAPHTVENTAAHNTTTNMSECQECHQTSLTKEHLQRKDDTGAALNCLTCHQSTKAPVQLAISAEKTNCDACHGQADHEPLHDNSVLDSNCTTCHLNNLSNEHQLNTKTQTKILNCDTCHENTNLYITGAINAGDQNCAACHSQVHNMAFAEKVPADIPLYAGFQWSIPNKATIWEGESWLPCEYVAAGKITITNSRKDVTVDQVRTFYQNEMLANGWAMATDAPASGAEAYAGKFTKGTRQATVFFHSGSVPGAAQAESGGYRFHILYK